MLDHLQRSEAFRKDHASEERPIHLRLSDPTRPDVAMSIIISATELRNNPTPEAVAALLSARFLNAYNALKGELAGGMPTDMADAITAMGRAMGSSTRNG